MATEQPRKVWSNPIYVYGSLIDFMSSTKSISHLQLDFLDGQCIDTLLAAFIRKNVVSSRRAIWCAPKQASRPTSRH